jgi:phosphomannomutase
MPAPLQIRFGTDGWRGVIARDVTFEAVRLVARAVAGTFRAIQPGPQPPLLAVGHDTRFLSRRFACAAAETLVAEGLNVCLTASHLPTPVLAWSVPLLGARGGLMITASHNPPHYNGLKVRIDDGGPAPPAMTRQIEAAACRVSAGALEGHERTLSPGGRDTSASITAFDPLPQYRERLGTLVDMERIARSGLHVVIDPMYGAGQGAMAALLLGIGLEAVEIHGEVNPGFGGVSPEPLPKHLGELAERVKGLSHSRRVGLALDGDGDRLAAIDEGGSYVTPHQIFALLLRHLVTRRGLSGTVVKTFSTTTMIDRLAVAHGLHLVVTPIGFKHVAEVMRRERVLIGGEESGGIGIAGHIPERDGIVSALLLLEALATEEEPLGALLAKLRAEVGPHCYRRLDQELDCVVDVGELERRIREALPVTIEGWRVKDVETVDGVKLIGADGSWLLIRPSGTEPVLRLYAEAPTFERVSAMLAWAKRCTDRIR